jgi:hypothetical protein
MALVAVTNVCRLQDLGVEVGRDDDMRGGWDSFIETSILNRL